MFFKKKTDCHICNNQMKTKKDEETPTICTICNADLVNPNSEIRIDITATDSVQAGGISAAMVMIILTDKRLIFHAEEGGEYVAGGGLIGGLISGAISAAIDSSARYNEILLTDIVSIDEKFVGLFKNKANITINTKAGEAFTMNITKKELEQWRPTLLKHANIEKSSSEF